MELGSDELDVGQTVNGWVRELDVDHQRIGLTMRRLPDRDPWERVEMRYQEGQVVEGTVENGTDFGVFVELEPGLSALIPVSELGLDRDTDPREAFNSGDKISASVLSVDGSRQRMSLSVRALEREKERQEYLKHTDRGPEEPSMTGFGAELMKALEKKKS
jgi:small subunit ribosomal protein S1